MNALRSASLLLALVLLSNGLWANVDFVEVNTTADWQGALQQARQRQVPLFVDIYTDWCGYCKKMDRDVYADASVGSYMNEHFVNVHLDGETSFGEAFVAKMSVRGFPTMVYLDTEEHLLHKLVGYTALREFLDESRQVIATAERWPELQAAAAAGTLDDEQHLLYFELLERRDSAQARQEALAYLDEVPEAEYLQHELSATLIQTYATDLSHPANAYFFAHPEQVKARYGSDFWNAFVEATFNQTMGQAIAAADEVLLEKLIAVALPAYIEETDQLPEAIMFTRKIYYGNLGEWDSYRQVIDAYYQEHEAGNADWLYGQAYEIVEDYPNQENLPIALAWSRQAQGLVDDFETATLIVFIQGMLGDYDAADEALRHARELAEGEEQLMLVSDMQGMINEARAED